MIEVWLTHRGTKCQNDSVLELDTEMHRFRIDDGNWHGCPYINDAENREWLEGHQWHLYDTAADWQRMPAGL